MAKSRRFSSRTSAVGRKWESKLKNPYVFSMRNLQGPKVGNKENNLIWFLVGHPRWAVSGKLEEKSIMFFDGCGIHLTAH